MQTTWSISILCIYVCYQWWISKKLQFLQYKWVDHSIKITNVYAQCKQCQLWIVLFYWYSFPLTLRRWQINLGVSKVSRALYMILTSLSETNLCYIFCGNSKGDNRYISTDCLCQITDNSEKHVLWIVNVVHCQCYVNEIFRWHLFVNRASCVETWPKRHISSRLGHMIRYQTIYNVYKDIKFATTYSHRIVAT